MDCPICYENFSEVRLKTTLRGCGHDICSICKTNIITSNHLVVYSQDCGVRCPLVTCPICRKVEKIPCERIDDVIAYYKGRLVADGNAIRQHCDEKRRLQQEVQRLRTQVGTQAPNISGLVLNIEVQNGQIVYRSSAPTLLAPDIALLAPALAPPPPVAPAPPAVAQRVFRKFNRLDIEAMLVSNVETLDYMAERETENYAGTTEFYYMQIRGALTNYLIDTVSRYIYEAYYNINALNEQQGDHYRRLDYRHRLVETRAGLEPVGFQVPIVPNLHSSQYEYVHIPANIVRLRNGNVEPLLQLSLPTTRINPAVINNPHANRAGVNATTRRNQPDKVETGSARRWCNCRHCPTANRTSRACAFPGCNKHCCSACYRCEDHNPNYNQPIPN